MTEEEYERELRRAGLPLLIEDYDARTDVFNRAVPLLAAIFVAEVLLPINSQWSALGNLAAVAGAFGVLSLAIAVANRARGLPFSSIPRSVGPAELAGFVVLPALLPGLISGHWGIAGLTAIGNLLILVVVLPLAGFGVVSIVRWALGRMLGQLATSWGLLVKAVPLLMIFSLILFFTPELWQVFGRLDDLSLNLLTTLLILLGAAFLVARLPAEVARIEAEVDTGPPLTKRQRVNVGLVLFIGQSLQILLVSLAVGAFFVALGLLTLDREILESWVGAEPEVLLSFGMGGREAVLSTEMLKVADVLSTFTGLYFAISMLTDELYRREFLTGLTDEMRRTFELRARYLESLEAKPAREGASPPGG